MLGWRNGRAGVVDPPDSASVFDHGDGVGNESAHAAGYANGRGESRSQARTPFPVPERPPLPRPERLNRNALTVVAVVMGVLVLAAVVFVQPRSATSTAQDTRPALEVARGTFLDQPSTGAAVGAAGNSSGNSASSASAGGYGFDGRGPRSGIASAPTDAGPTDLGTAAGGVPNGGYGGAPARGYNSRVYAGPYAGAYSTDGPVAAQVPAIVTPHPDPRAEAYRAALDAPLTASEATVDAASRAAVATIGQGSSPTSGAAMDVGSPDTYGAVAGRQAAGGIPTQTFASGGMRGTAHATMIRTSVDPAPGPYAIQAGTLIPAVLMTEINSDLPGEVLAQVSRDVYDSRSEQSLLIPEGSRLIGTYNDQIAAGQNRLLVAWTRVIFPDGRSVSLPGLETKDRAGAGGLHDQMDQHRRRVFGTAALLSLIGAGAQLSQPNGGYGAYGSYPSTGQIAAGAVGQQLADVATQMLRRNMDAQPTIRIRQGMPFNVFLNADMVFPGPYRPSYR
jgi:type IV secretory pathway VirB10-like protein